MNESMTSEIAVSFYSLLTRFKSEDNLTDVHPLIQNADLACLVQAWTKIQIKWKPPEMTNFSGLSMFDIWEIMWEHCYWDATELSLASGLSEGQVVLTHARARKLRLILPDGDIKTSARQMLNLEVGEFMKRGIKGLQKPKERGKKDDTPKVKFDA